MRAETIRRLLVFGVCALGVSALYLVPSLSHSPTRVAEPGLRGESSGPAGRPTSAPTAVAVSTGPGSTPSLAPAEDRPSVPMGSATAVLDLDPSPSEKSSAMGTPFTPGPVRDSTPPEPVLAVRLERATPETATLSWTRVFDDTGITAYRVWLNGYVVSTTTQTTATVRWFNDDSAQQIVQVRAVDAAGNQSERAASLLTVRPSESPTATPSAMSPTPTTAPSESPSPTTSPTTESAPKAEAAAPDAVSETPR